MFSVLGIWSRQSSRYSLITHSLEHVCVFVCGRADKLYRDQQPQGLRELNKTAESTSGATICCYINKTDIVYPTEYQATDDCLK